MCVCVCGGGGGGGGGLFEMRVGLESGQTRTHGNMDLTQ